MSQPENKYLSLITHVAGKVKKVYSTTKREAITEARRHTKTLPPGSRGEVMRHNGKGYVECVYCVRTDARGKLVEEDIT